MCVCDCARVLFVCFAFFPYTNWIYYIWCNCINYGSRPHQQFDCFLWFNFMCKLLLCMLSSISVLWLDISFHLFTSQWDSLVFILNLYRIFHFNELVFCEIKWVCISFLVIAFICVPFSCFLFFHISCIYYCKRCNFLAYGLINYLID